MTSPILDPTLDWLTAGDIAELCDGDRVAVRRWTEAFPLRAAVRLYGNTVPGDLTDVFEDED